MENDKSVKLLYHEQKDVEYGCVKFHHIYHGYPLYHSHDFYEYFICYQGEYKQIINNEVHYFRNLDCCLLRPEDAHSVEENKKDSSHYSILVRKDAFESFVNFTSPSLLEKLENNGTMYFSISENRVRKIIFYLNQLREEQNNKENVEVLTHLLLFNLLEPLFTQNSVYESEKRPSWLNDLLIEINKPDNLNWGVNEVVAHSNYSKTHLSRMFKEEMGRSIGDYLQEVKITNARDILVNSNMSIEELCDLIGHSSMSHFSSAFKKRYGMAPGKYRTKFKNKE